MLLRYSSTNRQASTPLLKDFLLSPPKSGIYLLPIARPLLHKCFDDGSNLYSKMVVFYSNL